jgi:outer membrane receptor for ferrienterochelin and colicins
MTISSRTSRWLLTASLTVGLWTTAGAQQPASDLSLEDLLDARVERVFGASKRLQPVTDAPSSVTIVTADEIARMGYQSLAELLRGVRGFYVSYDRNYSYLGARGFSLPGDYNTRVLLLVDGHRLNDNIYDQAAIGPELGLDLLSVERVEIIRGPSSSLYGTNAVFGVVNVITKTGAGVNGASADVQMGTFGSQRASIVTGTKKGDVDFSLAASVERSDGPESLYIPVYDTPNTNNGIALRLDDEEMGQVRGQLTRGALSVRGAYGRREKGVPTGAYGVQFNDPRLRTIDARAFVDVQYQRSIRKARLDVRTYVDRYRYEGAYPYGVMGEPDSLLHDYATGAWWGVDTRVSRSLAGRHTVTLGGEYRRNFAQDQGGFYDDPQTPTLFVRESSHTGGLYAQDEIAVSAKLLVNGGVRYDQYPGFSKVTPRAALIFKPTPNRAVKYLYGRAFRAPNAYELDYYTYQNPIGAESIESHEVIWEEYVGSWLRTSVSGFFNDANDLIRLDAVDGGALDDLLFINHGHVHAVGAEFEAEIKTRGGVHALTSYSVQRARDEDTRVGLTNSPRHLLKGRVMLPTVRRGSSMAVELDHISARTTLAGTRVDSATLVGLNVVEPLNRTIAVTLRVRNLLNRRYADPGSEEHLQDQIEQNGRTFTVGLKFGFR